MERPDFILWIEEVMKEYNLSRRAVGRIIGCGPSYISDILTSRFMPSIEMYSAIKVKLSRWIAEKEKIN